MDLQLKVQLRNTLLAQVDSLMREYNIPASDIEDALIYVQNSIKEVIIQDYLQDAYRKSQSEASVNEEVEDTE